MCSPLTTDTVTAEVAVLSKVVYPVFEKPNFQTFDLKFENSNLPLESVVVYFVAAAVSSPSSAEVAVT